MTFLTTELHTHTCTHTWSINVNSWKPTWSDVLLHATCGPSPPSHVHTRQQARTCIQGNNPLVSLALNGMLTRLVVMSLVSVHKSKPIATSGLCRIDLKELYHRETTIFIMWHSNLKYKFNVGGGKCCLVGSSWVS